ncbi:hypothetical protein BDV93DRAFT_527056 [Ceratobasidium sp. AG-I]|nr:hypothetical protein BDV93DRAFT_527056 [Ceratobasidium sp. AG-I]
MIMPDIRDPFATHSIATIFASCNFLLALFRSWPNLDAYRHAPYGQFSRCHHASPKR